MIQPRVRLKARSDVPPGGNFYYTVRDISLTGLDFQSLNASVRAQYRQLGRALPNDIDDLIDESTAKYCLERGHGHYISVTLPAITSQHSRIHRIDDSKLLPGCPHNYNPGMIRRDGKLWLVYRRHLSTGFSEAAVVELDKNLDPIFETNHVIKLPVFHADQVNEDPRVWTYGGDTWISWTTWDFATRYTRYVPCIRIGMFGRNSWGVEQGFTPCWGGNGGAVPQKNWSFFEHDSRLLCAYNFEPHHEIVEFDVLSNDECEGSLEDMQPSGMHWDYGTIRGGTPAVRYGDQFISFFHSRRGELRNGRYYMGAYMFDAKPPYTVRAFTKEPLLAGSEEDQFWNPHVLVVFPQGLVIDGDNVLVSIGVNDAYCAIYKTTMTELLPRMVKI